MRSLLVIALVIGCGKSSTPPPPSAPAPQPAAAVASSPPVDVHVDRRIETLAILERLAGSPEYREATPTGYLSDVDHQLGAFASHPAVAATRALHDRGIVFEQPMALAIHLDDHLAASQPTTDLDPRWKQVELDAYLAQVRAFAAEAKLNAFFDAHRTYIAAVEGRFRAALAAENPAPWFASVFGAAGATFTVVPALLQGPQNYGVRAGTAMYQVMGLGVPGRDGLPVVDDDVIALVVHEMAHSFVNPVIERHLAELEPVAAPLYALVEPDMRYLHYGSTKIMLFESVVRAVTILYIRDKQGDRAAADATRREVRRGFVWTAELADVLARFEKGKTHDLDAYAPRLVDFFTAQARRYEHGLPPMAFLGPIDAVFMKPPFAIVHAPALAGYATQVDQRIFKGTPKLAVATARAFDDLPHVGLVAYGTAGSNAVVANVLKRSGIAITADELRVGTKRFTGAGLVLLACWPRADDPSKGIVIYTAAKDDDLVGVNNVHAGGTDWVVARRRADGTFETLAAGDFPHAADGGWTLP